MNTSIFPVRRLSLISLCGLAALVVSCRREAPAVVVDTVPSGIMAPELQQNGLAGLPGAVSRSQADSALRWQPWTKATLERARDAKRLVFCVIAMPQQPGFQKILAALERDATVLEDIHTHYVPVLVDGDASREMGLLTADLCAEIKRPLNLPLFMWMTYEGNPVAWIPVAATDAPGVVELFNQSHNMVSQMWLGESAYVLKNSALDNANRRARLEQRKMAKVMSEQPAVDAVRSIRQLASLYDSFSRSFDEAGGLFPASSLELMAVSAIHPGLPRDVRERCMATVQDLLKDLLPSAMFDPLDGGVFAARRGISWSLPSFVRDCPSQSRIAVALMEAFRATGNREALDKALGLIAFTEKSFATEDGLFVVGLADETRPGDWMWSIEDVKSLLGPDDAAWWIEATGMKGLGNLPSEVDPRREFFRGNTLGLIKSPAEIAASRSESLEAFLPRFDAVRAKLLQARNNRIGEAARDTQAHAGASLRMVSAYATAFSLTGDDAFRTKAVALLQRCKERFAAGARLRVFPQEAPESIGAARAFLYALALQAVLDVAAITSDEQWLLWAEDLATTAAELFTSNQFLKECPDDARLIDLPVTDLVMLFDDSTAGLVSMAESRLADLGRPLVQVFSELATPLPTYTLDRPILHTDLLLATVARHYKVAVLLAPDAPAELRAAVQRLQPRIIHRRVAAADQVPPASAKVVLPDGTSIVVDSPSTLATAILPAPSP
jgi:uncharacterized protein YyaL (SSP411 family)